MQVSVQMDLDEAIRHIAGLIEDNIVADDLIEDVCLQVDNAVTQAINIENQNGALILEVEQLKRRVKELERDLTINR